MLKINRNNKIFHLTNTGDSQTNYKTNTRINEIYFFSFLTFDWTVKDVILLPTDNHLLWIDGIKIVEVRTRKIEIEEKKKKKLFGWFTWLWDYIFFQCWCFPQLWTDITNNFHIKIATKKDDYFSNRDLKPEYIVCCMFCFPWD